MHLLEQLKIETDYQIIRLTDYLLKSEAKK